MSCLFRPRGMFLPFLNVCINQRLSHMLLANLTYTSKHGMCVCYFSKVRLITEGSYFQNPFSWVRFGSQFQSLLIFFAVQVLANLKAFIALFRLLLAFSVLFLLLIFSLCLWCLSHLLNSTNLLVLFDYPCFSFFQFPICNRQLHFHLISLYPSQYQCNQTQVS